MNEPGDQSPYIVEPGHPNFNLYNRICTLFEADIPLVDGNNHKISKIYRDKNNAILIVIENFNDIITSTNLAQQYEIFEIFERIINHNDEQYRIETIRKTPNGIEITFKSINKNNTTGFLGAFKKSKRYTNVISLRKNGGYRKTHRAKKSKRNTKRHRK